MRINFLKISCIFFFFLFYFFLLPPFVVLEFDFGFIVNPKSGSENCLAYL